MNLEFECPHCNKLLAVDEKWRNTEVKCPNCGNSLVPAKVLAKNKEVERARKKEGEILENYFKREDEERAKQEEAQIRRLEREESHRTKSEKSNLIPCKECGKLVSPSAEKCPNCGTTTESERQRTLTSCGCSMAILIIVAVVLFIFVIGPCVEQPAYRNAQKKVEPYDSQKDYKLEDIQKQKKKAWEYGKKTGDYSLYQEFEELEKLYKEYR